MEIRPIRTDDDHAEALRRIDESTGRRPLSIHMIRRLNRGLGIQLVSFVGRG